MASREQSSQEGRDCGHDVEKAIEGERRKSIVCFNKDNETSTRIAVRIAPTGRPFEERADSHHS